MRIILLNRGGRSACCLDLSGPQAWLAGAALTLVLGISVAVGYSLAAMGPGEAASDELLQLRAELEAQRSSVEQLKVSSGEHINALAMRLGDLNANVIRLNALGSRLTGMAKLDDGEFDFDNPPAVGGPEESAESGAIAEGQLPDLQLSLDSLETTLDAQEQQLATLEGLMMNRQLNERVSPSGRPIKTGWLSSYFGRRSDPMTGKSSWHKGIDFAGKHGSEVIAVGDGVVTWSGDRYGYGNLVEIKHGNGYVTRYGHNQVNLVAVGDQVAQGQTIALMGSTGRSTGPHVHFEVHRNGKAVDPAKFIREN
jgi:murein DD-endopeptidase MepM/ murein hydrolase activator NlpD